MKYFRSFWLLVSGLLIYAILLPQGIDPDLWWHLRTGEWMSLSGKIPSHDIFSFTVHGAPWIAHEWLTERFLWLLYRGGGIPLTLGFFSLLGVVFFCLLVLRSGKNLLLGLSASVLAMLALEHVWGPRPQILTLFFMLVLLLVMERTRRNQWPVVSLYLLPPLFLLWANIHSGFMAGLFALAVFALGDLTQEFMQEPQVRFYDRKALRHLGAVIFLSLAACLVNPNGARLFEFPFMILKHPFMQHYIHEWKAPDFRDPRLMPFIVFLNLFVLSCLAGRQGFSVSEWALLLLTLSASLVSVRHIGFFIIVAAPVMARNFQSRFPAGSRVEKMPAAMIPGFFKILFFALILALSLGGTCLEFSNKMRLSGMSESFDYPEKALDFLSLRKGKDARIFNYYAWGGYLIWRGIPVFVDGRADIYSPAVLEDYTAIMNFNPNFEAVLDKYGIRYLLIPSGHILARALVRDPGMKNIYSDEVAIIFERAAVRGTGLKA